MKDDQLDFFTILENPTVDQLLTVDQIFESDSGELCARLTEDHRFDRKSSRIRPRELAKELSAFGNGPSHFGGVIAIGIENDKTITGCKSLGEESLQALESAGSDHCPDGRFETKRIACINSDGDDDFIILLRIRYVESRLVSLTNGEAYKRVADKTKKIGEEEKNEIRGNKGERSFEQELCQLPYPQSFHLDRIRSFCASIRQRDNLKSDITDEEILENKLLGQRTSDGFSVTTAGALMFATQPQRLFSGAYIRFLRYEGTEELSGKRFNVIKDRTFEGTVIDQIKNAASVISANLREFTNFESGHFVTRPEYPNDAWYELLVNAVAHRSYQSKNAPIFVKMFDDRIVFESPGGFMPQVTPHNIYQMHRPRNRFLMFAMKELGEVKCMNEGTRRVRQEMLEAELPEPIFGPTTSDNTGVRVVLKNDIANRQNSLDSEAYKTLGAALSLSLNPEERKIINYTIENGQINVSEALRIMTTNIWHTASNALKRLEKRGILDYVSSKHRDPKAHYIITKSSSDD